MQQDKNTLSLFEGYGIELEYMIVDQDSLTIRPIADKLFLQLTGTISDIIHGPISINNEITAHIVELKTTEPVGALEKAHELFQKEVVSINRELQTLNAHLMPTAMHPWMDPLQEMVLWPHGCSEIYDTLHRIFDCRGHGWANLQSMHINLPFRGESEFVRLHAAIRLVLPLIPSLAASSPFADGRLTAYKDTRLHTYKNNQSKIFSITGHVIPEVIRSYSDYQNLILSPIYEDLRGYDPESVLCHEWINSRGAIARFERSSIEIRVVDLQEAPIMDLSVAYLITQLIKLLTEERWATLESYHAFSPEFLKEILEKTVRRGEEVYIEELEYLNIFGLQKAVSTKELWYHILKYISVPSDYAFCLNLLLQKGTLATRIEQAVERSCLKSVYRSLCNCLQGGSLFVE